jgi:dethiobiotin synthetase
LNKGIFITGTDTGVGKTIVSAIVVRSLIKLGVKVGAMKPLETGCLKMLDSNNEEYLHPSDGSFLKDMACMDDKIDLVTPLRYELPLAPMVASDIEKRPIDLKRVFDSYNFLKDRYDFMVVEGVGGLLVPIKRIDESKNNIYFVSNLIKELSLPVLVVCRPTLGTINHTLLTVDYLLKEGITVKGIVINYHKPSEGSIAEKTNPDVLRDICPVPLIATIPYLEDINIENIDNIINKEGLAERFYRIIS